jgi:hypothetical protein
VQLALDTDGASRAAALIAAMIASPERAAQELAKSMPPVMIGR